MSKADGPEDFKPKRAPKKAVGRKRVKKSVKRKGTGKK